DSHFDYYPGEEVPPGRRAVQPITCLHVPGAIEVRCGDLGHPGDFEIYCRRPGSVTRNGKALEPSRDFVYEASRSLLRVPFAGETRLRIDGAMSVFAGAAARGQRTRRAGRGRADRFSA